MQIAFDTEKKAIARQLGRKRYLGAFRLLNVNDNTCSNADCALR